MEEFGRIFFDDYLKFKSYCFGVKVILIGDSSKYVGYKWYSVGRKSCYLLESAFNDSKKQSLNSSEQISFI